MWLGGAKRDMWLFLILVSLGLVFMLYVLFQFSVKANAKDSKRQANLNTKRGNGQIRSVSDLNPKQSDLAR